MIKLLSLSLVALGLAYADQTKVSSGDRGQSVEITRNGSLPSTKGPAENQ
jgi:hypothetical protein